MNGVLGGHGGDVIFDAVVPIQEEGRRGLEAAAQRHQQATGDVPCGEAAPGGLGAVHGDIECGVIKGLLNAEVGEAGHLAQLIQDLVRDLAVPLNIGTLELNVDRCRQAEIQNLRHHIRG